VNDGDDDNAQKSDGDDKQNCFGYVAQMVAPGARLDVLNIGRLGLADLCYGCRAGWAINTSLALAPCVAAAHDSHRTAKKASTTPMATASSQSATVLWFMAFLSQAAQVRPNAIECQDSEHWTPKP
jgi:hypothetical protein